MHDTLVAEALALPAHAVPLALVRAFASEVGGRAILVTEDPQLQLEAFARAGHCTLTLAPAPAARIETRWNRREVESILRDGGARIEWEGHTIEALLVEQIEGQRPRRHVLLAGESRALLERFFAQVCSFADLVGEAVMVFAHGCWNRSTALYQEIARASFDDLVLAPEVEATLRHDFTAFLAAEDAYAKLGVPWKRGALFVGPPGNGKTGAIKALVRAMGLPCVYVQSLENRFATEQQSIESVFRYAREIAPCVLVLEDLDALVTPTSRSFLLNELDGFARNHGLVTLGSTNHPDRLDPAIVDRPSRFDRKIHFPMPGVRERERFLLRWNERVPGEHRASADDLAELARRTDGYSFAYLQELFVSALMRLPAARGGGRSLAEVLRDEERALRGQMSSIDVVPEVSASPTFD